MNEKAIAERVAKSVTGAIYVPYTANRFRETEKKLRIEILTDSEELEGVGAKNYAVVGNYYFDEEQLDTFIDTLKGAQRGLKYAR